MVISVKVSKINCYMVITRAQDLIMYINNISHALKCKTREFLFFKLKTYILMTF